MPGPYTFTFYEDVDFNWIDREGETHHVKKKAGEQEEPIEDPCDALLYLNAALAKGILVRDDPDTRSTIKEVSDLCGATPGGSSFVTPPATPPGLEDPSATGPDTPAPEGRESSESLNAPLSRRNR